MEVNGYHSTHYAAQINGTTVITKAFARKNAVKFLQAKDPSLNDSDVYIYDGITDATTIDEVYSEPTREQDAKGELVWKDNYKVRMKEEYANFA
jgi:hypothetical protein